jgi:HPt (histidine-containing phosphotransfer) domain-containing protein
MSGDEERALAAGMDGYVTKPIKLAEVAVVLSQWVRDVTESPEPHVLDPAMVADLRELQSGGHLDVGDIVTRFLAGGRAKLDAVASAADAADAEAGARLAHDLAGSSATLGALELAKLCGYVERCIRAGDLTAVGESLPTIRDEFERVQRALKAAFPASSDASGEGSAEVERRDDQPLTHVEAMGVRPMHA